MTDRPIIFSAPMVRALLAGRKTQTRRVLKTEPLDVGVWTELPSETQESLDCEGWQQFGPVIAKANYETGDRLWVREAWQLHSRSTDVCTIAYAASINGGWTEAHEQFPDHFAARRSPKPFQAGWRPSIHMPRWASRLTLEVTGVRVQRLQDISEGDARAEGAMLHVPCKSAVAGTTVASDSWHFDKNLNGRLYEGRTAIDAFEILWGKINGWKSWDANPYVAALTFTVTHANIDVPMAREALNA